MSRRLSIAGVLALVAFRNLFANATKTLIIGGIIFLGTVLVVVGSAMLDSVEQSMSRSIIGSAAGHIQVYSGASKDSLAIWAATGQTSDLAPIEDFSKLRAVLDPIDNVQTVVPMAIKQALIAGGNTIDRTLANLRDAIRASREGDGARPSPEHIESLKQHVRQIVRSLQGSVDNLHSLSGERTVEAADVEAITRAVSDSFWSEFDAQPLASLEFLENRIAPQIADADLLIIDYVGTDLGRFVKSFDRFRIVDGEPVPPGRRGFLFSKYFYEENCKLRTARRLDKIHEALTVGGKRIATDSELQRLVRENVSQIREIVLQLDPERTVLAVQRLQGALGVSEKEISGLWSRFLDTNDENFGKRYDLFYAELAPLLELYRTRVGDMLTIQAISRSGYMRSVNVKVYGTFEFSGLEKSALAGTLNLMDLMSFRDLYGFLTADRAAEIEDIKQAAGARAVDRESAEAELFKGGTIVTTAAAANIDELGAFRGFNSAEQQKELVERVYTPDEIEKGIFLNAAVTLKDPARIDETMREIRAAAQRAGVDVKVVSWQEAAGILGQLVLLLRLVLYSAVLIIFSVALVIMSNATVMATLQRVPEIGTLRAIGSQKSFVIQMLLLEAVAVGVVFGLLGAFVGVGLVKLAGSVGIPALSDQLYFFFSGPRFYPAIGSTNVIVAFGIVLGVTLLSSLYPAWLATKVSPLAAMQATD